MNENGRGDRDKRQIMVGCGDTEGNDKEGRYGNCTTAEEHGLRIIER